MHQIRRANRRYGVRLGLFSVAAMLVGLPFAVLVQQVIQRGPVDRFDHRFDAALHQAVCGRWGVQGVAKGVTFFGSTAFLVPLVAVVAGYLLYRRLGHLAAFLVVTAVVSPALDTVIKVVVARPRPILVGCQVIESGKSFPSGHSMASLVIYSTLLLIALPALHGAAARRAAIGATAVLIVAVGLSRLVLGVHYPSDVLGSWILGSAWIATSVALFQIYRVERSRPPADVLAEGVEPESGPQLGR